MLIHALLAVSLAASIPVDKQIALGKHMAAQME
jgi:hypothetical protein